MRPTSRV
jgi:hypothetical protein